MLRLTTRHGYSLHMDPTDGRAQRLVETQGDMNAQSHELWRRLVASKPWDLIVDVGANYGEMILAAPPPHGATTVAFEPNTRLLPYLERNLAEAGHTVTVVPSAVSDHEGVASFVTDTEWSGTSHLGSGEPGSGEPGSVTVPVTTLDAYFEASTASTACVKIDVEGHDLETLRGGRRFFARLTSAAVMVEIIHMPTEVLAELAATWRLFLLDMRVQRLVRVPESDPEHALRMARASWCYALDAVLLPRSTSPWRPL